MKRPLGAVFVLALLYVGCGDDTVSRGVDAGTDVIISFDVTDTGDFEVEEDPIGPDVDDPVPDAVEVIEDLVEEGDVPPDLPPPPPRHSGLSFTSGGGSVSSANYSLTLFIGGPHPMGASRSGNYDVQLGPGAINNP